MWRHYCPIEKAWISVGKGEPCNWCEEKQAPAQGRDAGLVTPSKPDEAARIINIRERSNLT
jgi:hypothetical protein